MRGSRVRATQLVRIPGGVHQAQSSLAVGGIAYREELVDWIEHEARWWCHLRVGSMLEPPHYLPAGRIDMEVSWDDLKEPWRQKAYQIVRDIYPRLRFRDWGIRLPDRERSGLALNHGCPLRIWNNDEDLVPVVFSGGSDADPY